VKYPFKTDTGEVVHVSWEEMMDKDVQGCITLKDGRRAIEIRGPLKASKKEVEASWKSREIVSDSLGFPQHQFEEFEADRKLSGFSGIEYRRDPDVPEFYQVHAKSGSEWEKYLRHRGFVDRNKSDRGVKLAPGELEKAIALAKRSESS
jgi:hypothetical protein